VPHAASCVKKRRATNLTRTSAYEQRAFLVPWPTPHSISTVKAVKICGTSVCDACRLHIAWHITGRLYLENTGMF
jgi:hypothetical protein